MTHPVKRKEFPISPVFEAKRAKRGPVEERIAALPLPVEKLCQGIAPEPDVLRHHIRFWVGERRPDVLIEIYKKFWEIMKGDFELLREMGEAFYSVGCTMQASFCFSEALSLNPSSLSTLYFRAKLYAVRGLFPLAERDLAAIQERDQSLATCYLAAYIYFLKPDYEGALFHLLQAGPGVYISFHLFSLAKEIEAQIQDDEDCRQSLSMLLSEKLTEQQFLARGLTGVRKTPESVRFAVQFWTRNRCTPMVEVLYEDYSEFIDQDFEAILLLATYFFEEKDLERARVFIDKALFHRPNFPYLLSLKVQMFSLEQRFGNAVDQLKELMEVDDTIPSRCFAALIAFGGGQYDKIPRCFQGVADQIEFSPTIRNILKGTLDRIESSSVGMPENGLFWASVKDSITALI